MKNLATWDAILLDGLNRHVKTPGLLNIPPSWDWNLILDITQEHAQHTMTNYFLSIDVFRFRIQDSQMIFNGSESVKFSDHQGEVW